MAETFHSELILGISLCDVLWPSFTPVRSFTVSGISPSALFMPARIFPSFPAASSTSATPSVDMARKRKPSQEERDVRAEPLPVRKTRSMGHPQFRSTKSRPPAHSRAITSAVETSVAGLLPASWTPNICSEGCRRTRDHSSFEPVRKEVARPTEDVSAQPQEK